MYLDAVRAVALARIVLFHSLRQSWVLVFAALPLMFFVAGWLYAASMERRDAPAVVASRFRRILPSYWVYVAAMFVLWASLGVLWELSAFDWVAFAMPVLYPGAPPGPGAGTDLSLTWEALWYIQMHLILAIAGGGLRRLQQRRPVVLWSGLIGAVALTWLFVPIATLPWVFAGAWVLGYHHFDGDLARFLVPHRGSATAGRSPGLLGLVRVVFARCWWPVVVAVAVVFMVAVAAVAVTADGSAAAEGAEPSKVGIQAAALGMAVLGAFWLTVAVRYQPKLEPLLNGRRTRSTIAWTSQRSLTIYLWHMAAIYAAVALPLPGSSNWAGRVAWCLVGSLGAVLAFGWVEDLAARRRVRLWPTGAEGPVVPAVIDLRDGSGSNRPPQAGAATAPPPAGPDGA